MTEPAAKASPIAMKNAARLMAVQAVYQMAVNAKEAPFVIDEYLFLRQNMNVDGDTIVTADERLFRDIVHGVASRLEDLRQIVSSHRQKKDGSPAADEPLLEAVLLCGTYEIMAHGDIEPGIIISSYVNVAKAFFTGPEASLINAILDSIRRLIRT